MARRKRESSAVGRGSPPLIVTEMDPIDDHPALGRLRRASAAKMAKVVSKKRGAKIKVKVDVEAGGGS